ncbi:MAG: hypothetical protein C5B50_14585 [Verrucomicrobia bacterium]|nr:MAG: hypothetical protein C5B50_14585 [Verrucomicrobiota bacterium]
MMFLVVIGLDVVRPPGSAGILPACLEPVALAGKMPALPGGEVSNFVRSCCGFLEFGMYPTRIPPPPASPKLRRLRG